MIKKVSPIDIEGIYRNYLDAKQEENRKDHDILLEIKRDVHWIRSNMPGDSPT